MKCEHCTGYYKKDDMELQWVHELCGERMPAVDPAPVIKALRSIANSAHIRFDDHHEFKLWAQNVAQDALRAYDKEVT